MSQLKFLAFSDLEGRHDLISKLLDFDLSKYDFLLYKGDTPDPSMYKKIRKEQTLSGVAWEKRCTSAIIEDFPETRAAFMQAIEDSRKVNDVFAQIERESTHPRGTRQLRHRPDGRSRRCWALNRWISAGT